MQTVMCVKLLCLLLDASKAFDRVEYVRLFTTLRDVLCSFTFVNEHVHQSTNNIIINGVKQGGYLSPNHFSVFVMRITN